MGSDSTLKIASRIFDPKRRIPVGRGREKAGRAKTSQPHTQAVGEVDMESLRAAHREVSPGSARNKQVGNAKCCWKSKEAPIPSAPGRGTPAAEHCPPGRWENLWR